MTAKCGHTIDVWWNASKSTICQRCFEAQGFTYNHNSFKDMDRPRATLRDGAHLTKSKHTERNRRIREILGPHIRLGHRSTTDELQAQKDAVAQVTEMFDISSSSALKIARGLQ